MTLPSPLPLDLAQLLRLDFRPADLGDTPELYEQRIEYAVAAAQARPAGITLEQREAGARYLLLSAQIRQLNRQLEEFTAVGEVTLKQGLSVRLGQLRYEQTQQLRLSGLPGSAGPVRPVSVSVDVVATL